MVWLVQVVGCFALWLIGRGEMLAADNLLLRLILLTWSMIHAAVPFDRSLHETGPFFAGSSNTEHAHGAG
jgi:hypothetical protein